MNTVLINKNAIGYEALLCYGECGSYELFVRQPNIAAALHKAMEYASTDRVFVKLQLAWDREACCYTKKDGWDFDRSNRVAKHLVGKVNEK